jgi:sterol desaturase/sphingolipid hydroxylase (fatty acid hydroxylase superfamily)
MPVDFLAYEPLIRGGTFAALLMLIGLAESLAPRRPLRTARGFRWLNNLSMVVVDTVVVRLLFPLLAVEVALVSQRHGWGLFNQAAISNWAAVPLAVLALDFIIYFQHRLFHAVPWLWRLHMMHHVDPDIDVTTGVRFHPIEIVLSMLIKMAAVLALGAPALAVFLFEVLLNATSMFSHGNVRLPLGLDRFLRLMVVTPDMHRVHHSVIRQETDSNFGFNVPWWDRLFGTYREQPQGGHDAMTIGLPQFQDNLRQSLLWMLVVPFRGTTGEYPRRPGSGRPV